MTASHMDKETLTLTEQFARINQMQADINRKNQELRLAPISIAIQATVAVAGIFGAALALFKYISGAG